MNFPGWPHWLTQGRVTGRNADGELLALGLKNNEMWLCRLSKFSNEWCSVRQAYTNETQEWDRLFLATMNIGGADTRIEPGNGGQFYLKP